MKKNIIKILVVLVVIGLVVCVYCLKQTAGSKEINADIDLKNDKKAVKMINFIAPNCPACTQMQVLMNEVISEYKGIADISQIDIMDNEEMATTYNIMYTPTQVFFDKDGNEIERHEGFIGKKDLTEKLASLGVER